MSNNNEQRPKKKIGTTNKKPVRRSYDALGPEILWQYPGKFVVYREDEGRVIGVGDTEEEAFKEADESGVGGLWHSSSGGKPGEGMF
jgi:Family of unknown function (DUF5678)